MIPEPAEIRWNSTGMQYFSVAHAIFVLEGPRQHVGDNLHVVVTMSSNSLSPAHTIFINDSETTKTHVTWIVIARE